MTRKAKITIVSVVAGLLVFQLAWSLIGTLHRNSVLDELIPAVPAPAVLEAYFGQNDRARLIGVAKSMEEVAETLNAASGSQDQSDGQNEPFSRYYTLFGSCDQTAYLLESEHGDGYYYIVVHYDFESPELASDAYTGARKYYRADPAEINIPGLEQRAYQPYFSGPRGYTSDYPDESDYAFCRENAANAAWLPAYSVFWYSGDKAVSVVTNDCLNFVEFRDSLMEFCKGESL